METMDTVISGRRRGRAFLAGAIPQAKGMAGHRVLVLTTPMRRAKRSAFRAGTPQLYQSLPARPTGSCRRTCALPPGAAGFRPAEFVALIDRASIAWHERRWGSFFCDGSARQVIDMLLNRDARCRNCG